MNWPKVAAALGVALAASGGAAVGTHDPLAGRLAVATQRCVTQSGNQSLTILNDRALLYNPVGKRIYRNDLVARCPGLDPDDVLVIEPFGSQLCENDRIRAFHRGSHIAGPICRLGKFTAFEKAKP